MRDSESLEVLEDVVVQIAKVTSKPFPLVTPPGILLFAADHGVDLEREDVTTRSKNKMFLEHVLSGGAPICALTSQFDGAMKVVDIGIAANIDHEQLIDRKIRYGTDNFYYEDAMTRKEAIQAIEIGMEVTEEIINSGIRCLVLSNVGLPNSVCHDVIYSIVTGLNNNYDTLIKKREVNYDDPVDILAKVGGLEVAGMIGAILKAAERKIPIIIDGPVSLIAALLAYKLSKHSKSYLFLAQKNHDSTSLQVTEFLGLRPILELDYRLLDGAGALFAYSLIHSVLKIVIETISLKE